MPDDQLPFDDGESSAAPNGNPDSSSDRPSTGAAAADPASGSTPEPATDEHPEATSSSDAEVGRESGESPNPAEVPAAADPGSAQHDPTPPSGSPNVAAETAPAQVTGGSSQEVDTVPAPQPEAPVYRRGMFGAHDSGDTSGFGGLQRRVPVSAGASRPYGSWFDAADDALATTVPDFGDAIEKVVVDRGELTYHVRKSSLLPMLQTLRDDPSLRFELLSSVSGVHYPDDVDGRPLHSVYQLTSLTYRRRLRVEVATTDEDPHVPSAVGIYPTADWQERETFDMFGIEYDGHPGLTRILMPDDWVGHPQRKDYPLGGIPVEYKGASIPPPDERRSYS